jgi:hypothetical protein
VFHQAFIPAPHQHINSLKEKLQTYCVNTYAKSGVNQMWILKNSEDPLANLKAQNISQIDCIKTYDFSTLYTTIPHDEL